MDIPISTHKGCPTRQIQYVQEEAMYECNQFEYRAATQGNIICHIQLVHEGARHDCNQCEYIATHKSYRARHIRVR